MEGVTKLRPLHQAINPDVVSSWKRGKAETPARARRIVPSGQSEEGVSTGAVGDHEVGNE